MSDVQDKVAATDRQEDTRQRLIDAAFTLFEAHGFDNVTVEQIAQQAGVARRTFFRYFPSKEKVVFPFTDERRAQFHATVRARTGGAPATFDDIREVYRAVALTWIENKERMIRNRRIVSQSPSLLMYDHAVISKWENAVAIELDGADIAGVEPVDMDVAGRSLRSRVMAGIIVGAMQPVFARWYECNGEFDLVTMGDRALDVAMRGLENSTDDLRT